MPHVRLTCEDALAGRPGRPGSHYLGVYLTVAGVIVLGVLLSLGLFIQQRRDAREHASPAGQPRWGAVSEDSSA
jgi:hypothetical protein